LAGQGRKRISRAILAQGAPRGRVIPFVEELLTAYYCAFDKATPLPVRASLFGALAYFLLPTDAIPDVLPVLGFTDDAAMLAAALKLMASHIRPEHRAAAKGTLAEFSKA
jgi:uncharacterized membrane protein YkvA (DUF1232 family)